jgi:hypothetical protein
MFEVPVPVTPLYAQIAVLGQALVGGPAGTCVTTCAQLVRALDLWGIRARAVAAHATVYRLEGRTLRPVAAVGTTTGEPTVRPDGTTNGHMIVWSADFKRYIDLTIAQAAPLLAAGQTDIRTMLPSVIAVEDEHELNQLPAGARAGGFAVTWRTTPEWTTLLDSMVTGDLHVAVEYNALLLAHGALEALATVSSNRNLRQLHSLFPKLGALLSGRKNLPAIPDTPPTSSLSYLRPAVNE